MTKKYSNHITNGKVLFIDLWSMIYLFIVCVMTLLFDQANIFVFGIYLICALPFSIIRTSLFVFASCCQLWPISS